MAGQPVATPNTLMMQVGIMEPAAPGAVGGVLLQMGSLQQRVDTLLDPDQADQLAAWLVEAATAARRAALGLVVAQQMPGPGRA